MKESREHEEAVEVIAPLLRVAHHRVPEKGVRQDLRTLPPDLVAFRQNTVNLLARVIPSTIVLWETVESELGEYEVQYSRPEMGHKKTNAHDHFEAPDAPAKLRELFRWHQEKGQHYGSANPIMARYRATGDVTPYAVSDLMSDIDDRQSRLYRECYLREHGATDALFTFISDPRAVNAITIERDSWGFSSDEKRLISNLRGYTQNIYDTIVTLLRSRGSVDLVDEDAPDVVVLDRAGHPLHIGTRALRVLGRVLGEDRPIRDAEVYSGIRSAAEAGGGRVRLSETASARVAGTEEGAIILIEDADQFVEPVRRQGLSARQLAIMRMIDAGDSSRMIARALGISPRTVDKHVERALRVLEVRSRGEATAVLFGRRMS